MRVAGRARAWLTTAAACTLLALAGCRTPTPGPTAPLPDAAPEVPADGNAFEVAHTVNDTWNTIGQVLVALPGVTYETRAQMLALYAVRYRGEAFLVRAVGIPVDPAAPALRTRVEAITPSGAPLRSAASADLLGLLAARVPARIPLDRERLAAQEQAKADAARAKQARGKKARRKR